MVLFTILNQNEVQIYSQGSQGKTPRKTRLQVKLHNDPSSYQNQATQGSDFQHPVPASSCAHTLQHLQKLLVSYFLARLGPLESFSACNFLSGGIISSTWPQILVHSPSKLPTVPLDVSQGALSLLRPDTEGPKSPLPVGGILS